MSAPERCPIKKCRSMNILDDEESLDCFYCGACGHKFRIIGGDTKW